SSAAILLMLSCSLFFLFLPASPPPDIYSLSLHDALPIFPSFTVTAVPSMRMAVDMSGLDEATWVNLTGNSGHPMSKNYSDQFSAWAAGETFPWNFSRDAVAAAAKDTQMLLPPGE